MLVKSLTRSKPTYANLINYILNPSKSLNGSPEVIKHNLRANDEQGYAKEFIQNESYRKHHRDTQVYLYHEIIGLHSEEDKELITPEIMQDLVRKYIELRGYDGMYLASIHNNGTDSIHAHIISSGLKFRTGLAHRMTQKQFLELKLSFQDYHKNKYPELSKSICQHGKQKYYITNKEWQKSNKNRLTRNQIKDQVQSIFKQSKTQTQFLDSLRENNLHHYERGNKIQGIISENGTKYRFSRLEIDLNELPILETQKPMDKTKDSALLEYQKGGTLSFDKEKETHYLITTDGNSIPLSKETFNELQSLPNNYRIQINEIQKKLDDLYQRKDNLLLEFQNNPNRGTPDQKIEFDSIILEESKLLSKSEDLRLTVEANHYAGLEKDEEEKLLNDIQNLRYGNSDQYQIFHDTNEKGEQEFDSFIAEFEDPENEDSLTQEELEILGIEDDNEIENELERDDDLEYEF